MLRYLVIQKKDTNPNLPSSYEVHVWDSDSERPITHMDYIAQLAGLKKDVSKLHGSEKLPFIEVMTRLSSMGRVRSSRSQGWFLEDVEATLKYKHRLEQDCDLVLRHLDRVYGFPEKDKRNIPVCRFEGRD